MAKVGLEKKYTLSVEKSLVDEIFMKWLITNFKNYNDSSDCYGYFADNAFLIAKKDKFWTFPTVKDFSDRIRKKKILKEFCFLSDA